MLQAVAFRLRRMISADSVFAVMVELPKCLSQLEARFNLLHVSNYFLSIGPLLVDDVHKLERLRKFIIIHLIVFCLDGLEFCVWVQIEGAASKRLYVVDCFATGTLKNDILEICIPG